MFSYTCIALCQCLCSFMWRYATDSSSVRSITPTRPYKLYAAAFWQRNKWDEPIWTCLKQGIRRALHADMMVAQTWVSTLFKQAQPAGPSSPKPAAHHTAHGVVSFRSKLKNRAQNPPGRAHFTFRNRFLIMGSRNRYDMLESMSGIYPSHQNRS